MGAQRPQAANMPQHTKMPPMAFIGASKLETAKSNKFVEDPKKAKKNVSLTFLFLDATHVYDLRPVTLAHACLRIHRSNLTYSCLFINFILINIGFENSNDRKSSSVRQSRNDGTWLRCEFQEMKNVNSYVTHVNHCLLHISSLTFPERSELVKKRNSKIDS